MNLSNSAPFPPSHLTPVNKNIWLKINLMLLAVQFLELFSLINIIHVPPFPKPPEKVSVLQSNAHKYEN